MVTKEQAMSVRLGETFYHKTAKNADGTAVRCRVNGQCKTWKTRRAEYRLPVKYGLREWMQEGDYLSWFYPEKDPEVGDKPNSVVVCDDCGGLTDASARILEKEWREVGC
jgi:hypothetical protein